MALIKKIMNCFRIKNGTAFSIDGNKYFSSTLFFEENIKSRGIYNIEVTEEKDPIIVSKSEFISNFSKYKNSYSQRDDYKFKIYNLVKKTIPITVDSIDYDNNLVSFRLNEKLNISKIEVEKGKKHSFGFPQDNLCNYSEEMLNSVIKSMYFKCNLSILKIRAAKQLKFNSIYNNLIDRYKVQYMTLKLSLPIKCKKSDPDLFYCILIRDCIDTMLFLKKIPHPDKKKQLKTIKNNIIDAMELLKPECKCIKKIIKSILNDSINLSEAYHKTLTIEDKIISKNIAISIEKNEKIYAKNQLIGIPCKEIKKSKNAAIYTGLFTTGFMGSPIINSSNEVICHVSSCIIGEEIKSNIAPNLKSKIKANFGMYS